MVDQAKMNGRTDSQRAGTALRANVVGLLHDVIALAELQAKLLSVDVREARSNSAAPLILMLGGIILALGAVPVLLLGVCWMLIDVASLSEAVAFLVTAITSLLVAVALAWGGWLKLSSVLAPLSRSRQELSSNIRWIKSALKRRSFPT